MTMLCEFNLASVELFCCNESTHNFALVLLVVFLLEKSPTPLVRLHQRGFALLITTMAYRQNRYAHVAAQYVPETHAVHLLLGSRCISHGGLQAPGWLQCNPYRAGSVLVSSYLSARLASVLRRTMCCVAVAGRGDRSNAHQSASCLCVFVWVAAVPLVPCSCPLLRAFVLVCAQCYVRPEVGGPTSGWSRLGGSITSHAEGVAFQVACAVPRKLRHVCISSRTFLSRRG